MFAKPRWTTEWAKTPADWPTDSLGPSLRLLPEMLCLQSFGDQASQLKELPWMGIAREIAEGASTTSSTFASGCSLTVPELRRHLASWRASSYLVDAVIGWKGHYEPKELCEASRPGAWLADFIYTLLLVEKKLAKPKVKFCVVLNSTYVAVARELGLIHDQYRSANNVGNVVEWLAWAAYEERKYAFLVSLLGRCVELREQSSAAQTTTLASLASSGAGAAPLASSGAGAAPAEGPTSEGDVDEPGVLGPCHIVFPAQRPADEAAKVAEQERQRVSELRAETKVSVTLPASNRHSDESIEQARPNDTWAGIREVPGADGSDWTPVEAARQRADSRGERRVTRGQWNHDTRTWDKDTWTWHEDRSDAGHWQGQSSSSSSAGWDNSDRWSDRRWQEQPAGAATVLPGIETRLDDDWEEVTLEEPVVQQPAALPPWLQSKLGKALRQLVAPTPADIDRWMEEIRDAFHAQPDQLRTVEIDAAEDLGSRQRSARKAGRWRAFLNTQYGGKEGLRRALAARAGGSGLPSPLNLGSHDPEGRRPRRRTPPKRGRRA